MRSPSKVLVVSYYYPPDFSAGSFRVKALVDMLLDELPKSCVVEVITTKPNRYASARQFIPTTEVLFEGRLIVHRIQVSQLQSGMLGQVLGFFEYARRSRQFIGSRRFDVVMATSSRLATAMLGAYFGRRNSEFCYLDIRDIFADNLEFVLPLGLRRIGKLFFSLCERWALSRADCINLVSLGFRGYFESRYPLLNFSYFSNGVDVDFVESKAVETTPEQYCRSQSGKSRILYAGNIGIAQGLDRILPTLGCELGEDFELIVIGDGSAKRELEYQLKAHNVENVVILPPLSRGKLLAEYYQADILLLHLNDFLPLRKVLPSKLFEYAATGRPIVAGVTGYASDFVESEIENAIVFSPCDVVSAVDAIKRVSVDTVCRSKFVKKFDRRRIMREMVLNMLKRFYSAGHEY